MTEPVAPATVDAPSTRAEPREVRWWRRYVGPESTYPGVRAQLRRCRSSQDALGVPAAVLLATMLGGLKSAGDGRLGRALDLARVLSHVRLHESATRPMRSAGYDRFPHGQSDEKPKKLSEQRFRRLLEVQEGEELVTAFVRLIALLDGQVNVAAVSRAFLDWTHPDRGDEVRKAWAFDYYAAGDSAPLNTSTWKESE